ncbi:MAG: phosphotransferase [bacterium]
MLDKFENIYKKTIELGLKDKSPVDKQEVFSLADSLGLKNPVQKSKDTGEHLVLAGDLNGKKVIFKANVNPAFINRTLTEIYTLIKFNGKLNNEFIVPKVLNFDLTDDKYLWVFIEKFIENFVDGKTFEGVEILSKATLAVIRSNMSIPHKDNPRLDKIKEGKQYELLKVVVDLAYEWNKEFEHNIDKLVSVLKKYPLKDFPITCVHGDLVHRHILNLGNKFAIIDWELAGGAYFWGYEPAYIYHRLYTRDGTKETAEYYKKRFLNSLNKEETILFNKTFKPMLAQRIIGGYKDYKDKNSKEYSFNRELEETVLQSGNFS